MKSKFKNESKFKVGDEILIKNNPKTWCSRADKTCLSPLDLNYPKTGIIKNIAMIAETIIIIKKNLDL